MALYKRSFFKTKRRAPVATRRVRKPVTAVKAGFAASPAGKHRRLALSAFALAKKARAAGNKVHYLRMLNFGKRALAISKNELRLWKSGQALRTKAFAAHRSVRAAAKPRTARFAYR